MKVKIKKEKGITLIALVVTIVVLLILAAIAIGMLMGENGVIKKAEESKEETTRGKERELIKLAYQNLEMERQTNGIEITTDRIGNKMKEYDEKTKAKGIEEEEIGEKEIVVTRPNSSGYAEIEYEETGHKYIVPLIVNTNEVYTIKYNLDGGTDPGNPTQYTPTQTITLNPPTKSWNKFTGWTGSNGTTPEKIVVIPRGSTGNKEYTAHWEEIEPICKIGETKYASVQEAIEACSKSAGEEKTTIIMLKSTEEEFNTYEGQNIILDLQGKVITSSSTSKTLCTNNGKLQIIDNSSGKTGKLESTKGTTIQNKTTGAITIGDNSTNIDNNTPTIYGKQIGIKTDGEFNFYDGKIQGITPIQGNVTKTPEGFGPVTTDYTDGITTMQLGIVTGYEARINWVYYTTVQEAVDATKTDVKETVVILKDIQLQDILQISESRNMALDLDGHTLTIVPEKDKVIENNGELRITDKSIEQTGKININSSLQGNSWKIIFTEAIYNTGELILEKGIINAEFIGSNKYSYIRTIYNDTGNVEILGGTVSSSEGYQIYSVNTGNIIVKGGIVKGGIYNESTGDVMIEGGTISSNSDGICNKSAGNVIMKGGTINCEKYGIYNLGTGNVTIEDGIISSSGEGQSGGVYNESVGNIIVKRGTISGESKASQYSKSSGFGIYNQGTGDITVEGGTISSSASYGLKSYGIYNQSTGNITVKEGTVISKQGSASYGIYNESTGNITIEGGTVSGNCGSSGNSYGIYNNSVGNIIIKERGTASSESSANDISGSYYSYGIYNKGTGNVTIEGGTVSCKKTSSSGNYDSSYGIYNYSEGNIILKKGAIVRSSNKNNYGSSRSSCYGIYNSGTGNVIVEEGSVSSSSNLYCSSYGIYNGNTGSIIIGKKNELVTQNDINIKGECIEYNYKGYGIYNRNGNVEFYNGIIQGDIAIKGNITQIRKGYEIENSIIEKKDTIYLVEENKEYIVQIEETKYYNFKEAIESIADEEEKTLIVLKDFELKEKVVFNKNIILDLNGCVITNKYYKIENIGNLKITDTTESKSGKIESIGTIDGIINKDNGNIFIEEGIISYNCSGRNDESYGIYNLSTGNIIVEGGTVSSNCKDHSNSYGIYNAGIGNVEIKKEGTVSASASDRDSITYGIYNASTGNVVIEGGILNSKNSGSFGKSYGIYNTSTGSVTVKDGNISSSSSSSSYGIYNNTGSVTVKGGNISSSSSSSYGIYNNKGNVTVERGIISGSGSNSYGIYNNSTGNITIGIKGDGVKLKDDIYIYGERKYGIYNVKGILCLYDGEIEGGTKAVYDIITEREENTELKYNEDETVLTLTTEKIPIAQIREKIYTNLQEAIDAVGTEQETVKILRNITYTNEDAVITNNKNIVIDLNGYTIISAIPEKTIQNEGLLKIIDTSEEKTSLMVTSEETTIKNLNGATLIVSGGTIENKTKQAIYNEGELEIKGGIISTNNSSNSYGIYNANTGNVTIEEGTVSSSSSNNYSNSYGIYNSSTGNITITGGEVSSTASGGSSTSYGIYNENTGSVIVGKGTVSGTSYGIYNKNAGNVEVKEEGIVSGESYGIYNIGIGNVIVKSGRVSSNWYNGDGIYNSGTGNVIVEKGIINGNKHGISNVGEGNIIIGKKGDGIILLGELLYIKGEYGINNSKGKLYYYDGKIEGRTRAISSNIEEVEELTELKILKNDKTEEITLEQKESNGVKVNDIEYESVQKAVEANADNKITIVFTRDINPSTTIRIEENQNITIDLNGYTMKNYPEIQNKGILKIIDTSESKTGKIIGLAVNAITNTGTVQLEGGIIADSGYGINNKGEAIINGGKIENNTYGIYNSEGNVTIQNGTTISNNTYGIYNYPGTIAINNGVIISENTYGTYNYSGTTNVNSNITGGNYGIYISSGVTNINKGVQISSDTGVYNTGGTTNIKEGVQISANIGINNTRGTVTIGEQGTMNPDSPIIIGEEYGLVNKATVNMYDGKIKGKTGATQGFITKTETGYTVASRTEGEYKVDYLALEGTVSTVAQVHGVNYSNLQSAINSIVGEEQQTIKLTNGIITTSKLQINEGQNIILDMNGKTISSDLEITLENAGTLTIIDTSGNNVARISSTGGIAIKNTGTLTIGEDDETENANLIIIEGLENTGILNKYDGTINEN